MVEKHTLSAAYLFISTQHWTLYLVRGEKNYCGVGVYLTCCLSDKRFRWIFSGSHHGKGEPDGHGATVKRGGRLYVLARK
jgi:hypothetical protein